MKITSTLFGSALAFLLATSCCWLPWLAVLMGSAVLGAPALTTKLETFSGPLLLLGGGLLVSAGLRFWQQSRQKQRIPAVRLQSTITCPDCGFAKIETMPTNACQFFYDCENCKALLKPLAGDCCVFCSYGTVKCPPMQTGSLNCC